ncbi:hypothetical protein Y1Q_0002664 [Alligator mississippiensis]|uniref:Uncharacterized protein n=1 Tax=Alligator mississippiensis TaxID=8496 RepID=A0A151NZE7_ALLMI|nr:hypothetical protein Y1Q_0002664 [Alligator mississippiensis]
MKISCPCEPYHNSKMKSESFQVLSAYWGLNGEVNNVSSPFLICMPLKLSVLSQHEMTTCFIYTVHHLQHHVFLHSPPRQYSLNRNSGKLEMTASFLE